MGLRPLVPDDFERLFYLATSSDSFESWRLRGRTLSFPEFADFLRSQCDAQFVVCGSSGEVIGHVCSYQSDLSAGHTKVALLLAPEVQGLSWPLASIPLFLAHLFSTRPMRQVYFELPTFNADKLRFFLSGFCVRTALFEGYLFAFGAHHDMEVWSLSAEGWVAFKQSSLGLACLGS